MSGWLIVLQTRWKARRGQWLPSGLRGEVSVAAKTRLTRGIANCPARARLILIALVILATLQLVAPAGSLAGMVPWTDLTLMQGVTHGPTHSRPGQKVLGARLWGDRGIREGAKETLVAVVMVLSDLLSDQGSPMLGTGEMRGSMKLQETARMANERIGLKAGATSAAPAREPLGEMMGKD